MTDVTTGRQTLEMGALFMTATVNRWMADSSAFFRFVNGCIGRHKYRDWGDCDQLDRECNDDALTTGARIVSTYRFPENVKVPGESRVWIITEANRAYTTVLFPSDY